MLGGYLRGFGGLCAVDDGSEFFHSNIFRFAVDAVLLTYHPSLLTKQVM